MGEFEKLYEEMFGCPYKDTVRKPTKASSATVTTLSDYELRESYIKINGGSLEDEQRFEEGNNN